MTYKPATFTLAAALAFTGVAAANSATAEAPERRVVTLDRDVFVDRFDCLTAPERGYWSPASELLTHRRAIKTSVWRLQSDKTALIRAGVNKATASAVTRVGDLRLVCRSRVPFGVRVRWS